MSNLGAVFYKLTKVRITKLDRCGNRVDSTCSYIVDECVVSVEETAEYKDREEWYPENGDGDFCATVTTPPKKKWLNLVLTFNDTNPQLINFLTGSTVLLDDDDTTVPNQIGYGDDYGSVDLGNFALEGWTRIAADCLNGLDGCPDDGTENFGYVLYPFIKEGTIGDVTYQNDVATFVVNAIATRNSPWGTGPYNVYKSEATATLGVPMPLFSAIPATRFKQMSFTKLAPPDPNSCDCQDLTPPLTFVDSGVLTGMATLPLRNGLPILPGYITWGDASVPQLVTAGLTVSHTYGAPASYVATYKPLESGPSYVSASTPIA